MQGWSNITLGDIVTVLARYRPFLLLVSAILAIALLLPGTGDTSEVASNDTAASLTDNTNGEPSGVTDTTALDGSDPLGAAMGTSTRATSSGASGSPGGTAAVGVKFGPDCDTAIGRLRVPAFGAPPCMPGFSGNNGGVTYQGVTKDSISVVWYRPKADPAVTAALTAAGAANTPEETAETFNAYVDYFNTHYELYGRKVKITVVEGSGAAEDDAAAKADAIDVANRRPFAVIGGTAINGFTTTIAQKKILCICTVSQPQEYYESLAPYVGYTTLMSSTEGYIQRAEYIGKRLAGRNAKWAGDLTYTQQKRVFGLLYYETADQSYKLGVDSFERELAAYNVKLKTRLAFQYPLTGIQEQARSMISRLKEDGVTSVIFSGDPITPAIFTSEATRQQYNPEWIITGSALVDTTLFARTYDASQWRHAFGISFLTARAPAEQGDAFRVHMWHLGRAPTADNSYGVIYASPFALFTGLHMAGANLTPQSFQKGLFAFPPLGRGKITVPTSSWGNHGFWKFTDYTQFDDVTEIWWDTQATGPDEVDNPGVGMYRYVDGGKRYLPGEHPNSDPKAFVTEGSVTLYDKRPASDGEPPTYPHDAKQHH